MTRRNFVLGFAVFHLAAVVCGAARLSPAAALPPIQQTLTTYGAYTGADNGYGFFAPRVGSQWRAVCHLRDRDGRQWTDASAVDGNLEARTRMSTIFSNFMEDDLREHIAASWAALMFGRHPSAEFVVVEIQAFHVPSMDKFRTGEQPAWVAIEIVPFHRAARNSVEE